MRAEVYEGVYADGAHDFGLTKSFLLLRVKKFDLLGANYYERAFQVSVKELFLERMVDESCVVKVVRTFDWHAHVCNSDLIVLFVFFFSLLLIIICVCVCRLHDTG